MKCSCSINSIFRGKEIKGKISTELVEVKKVMTGWFTLYKCVACGAYWEKYYPEGEYHGGGEPALRKVEAKYIKEKYGIE